MEVCSSGSEHHVNAGLGGGSDSHQCPREMQQPPFRQEAHCMYFCGPAVVPKLFSYDPLAF